MPRVTRTIYDSNPATFNAAQAGVGIGDLIVDPAGVNSPRIVRGPNIARTVQVFPSSASLPNSITPGTSSTGAGNRGLSFTILDGSGVPIPFAPVTVGVVIAANPATVVINLGLGAIVETAEQYVISGIASVGGSFGLDVNGTPADTVNAFCVFGTVMVQTSTTIP
jgi:hypothetical protein